MKLRWRGKLGITFGIILAGIPVYYAWRAWSGRGEVVAAVD